MRLSSDHYLYRRRTSRVHTFHFRSRQVHLEFRTFSFSQFHHLPIPKPCEPHSRVHTFLLRSPGNAPPVSDMLGLTSSKLYHLAITEPDLHRRCTSGKHTFPFRYPGNAPRVSDVLFFSSNQQGFIPRTASRLRSRCTLDSRWSNAIEVRRTSLQPGSGGTINQTFHRVFGRKIEAIR